MLFSKFSSDGRQAELIEARKAIIKFEKQQTREVLAEAAGVDPSVISNLKRGIYKTVTEEVKCFLINAFNEGFDSLFCYRDDFSYNIDFIIREKIIIRFKTSSFLNIYFQAQQLHEKYQLNFKESFLTRRSTRLNIYILNFIIV